MSAKIIATALSIAPKTTETHIRNIFAKAGSRTRDGIIDFIEKSDKDVFIKKHYENLQDYVTFKQILKQVKQILIKQNQQLSCLIAYWQEYETSQNAAAQLEDFLKEVGIKSYSKTQSPFNNLTEFIKKPFPEGLDRVIYILPDEMLLKLQAASLNTPEESPIHLHSIQNIALPFNNSMDNKLFIFQDKKETTLIPEAFKKAGYAELKDKEICYAALIDLLKHLLPEIEWKSIETRFKGQGCIYKALSNGSSSRENLEKEPFDNYKIVFKRFIRFLKRRNYFLFFWVFLL